MNFFSLGGFFRWISSSENEGIKSDGEIRAKPDGEKRIRHEGIKSGGKIRAKSDGERQSGGSIKIGGGQTCNN